MRAAPSNVNVEVASGTWQSNPCDPPIDPSGSTGANHVTSNAAEGYGSLFSKAAA
jgi:hypothetical protein